MAIRMKLDRAPEDLTQETRTAMQAMTVAATAVMRAALVRRERLPAWFEPREPVV
jgi:hypothetical protein